VLLSSLVVEVLEGSGRSPVGAAVMSPWTDLALSGGSMETRDEADPLLTKDSLASAARLYLGARGPRASPLYGDLAGLKPVRMHVGEDEFSSVTRFATASASKTRAGPFRCMRGRA